MCSRYGAAHLMIVVVLLTIATGALLLWALYTEQVPPPRSRVQGPRWAGLPSPADIQRHDFPLAVGGYDPLAVDAHLRAVSDAFATLRARTTAGPHAETGATPPVADATPGVAATPISEDDVPPPDDADRIDQPDVASLVDPAAAPGGAWRPPAPPPEGRDDRPPDAQSGSVGSIGDG